MKKYLFLLMGSIVVGHLIFCYTIPIMPSQYSKKHKIYGVDYFPDPYSFFFNPFKKKRLKRKILEYANSNLYDTNTEKIVSIPPHFLQTYFEGLKSTVASGEFELVSLKYEKPFYHILVCDLIDSESTIVFKLNASIDRITEHY